MRLRSCYYSQLAWWSTLLSSGSKLSIKFLCEARRSSSSCLANDNKIHPVISHRDLRWHALTWQAHPQIISLMTPKYRGRASDVEVTPLVIVPKWAVGHSIRVGRSAVIWESKHIWRVRGLYRLCERGVSGDFTQQVIGEHGDISWRHNTSARLINIGFHSLLHRVSIFVVLAGIHCIQAINKASVNVREHAMNMPLNWTSTDFCHEFKVLSWNLGE